jgi:TRAP-type C4-dicarboxylate transport system permease small subunit
MFDQKGWKLLKIVIACLCFIVFIFGFWGGLTMAQTYFNGKSDTRISVD